VSTEVLPWKQLQWKLLSSHSDKIVTTDETTTFPKQRIAENVRSNLGERCPLLSPRAPYLIVPNWRSNKRDKERTRREHTRERRTRQQKKTRSSKLEVITIVLCVRMSVH
jgi:hypothetical protein